MFGIKVVLFASLFLSICIVLTAAEPAASLPDPVAAIGQMKISRAELQKYAQEKFPHETDPFEPVKDQLYELTVSYVDQLLLKTEATKAGAPPSLQLAEKVLRAELDKMPELEKRDLIQKCNAQGTTLDHYILRQAGNRSIQRQTAVDAFVEKNFRRGKTVDIEDCILYYQENLDKFMIPADPPNTVRAQLMTVTSTNVNAETLLETAKQIVLELQGGSTMEQLIAKKKYPQVRLTMSDFNVVQENIAASNRIGQMVLQCPESTVNGPFEYAAGCLLIIYRDLPKQKHMQSYQDSLDSIAQLLIAQKVAKELQTYLDKLFLDYQVQIFVPQTVKEKPKDITDIDDLKTTELN